MDAIATLVPFNFSVGKLTGCAVGVSVWLPMTIRGAFADARDVVALAVD